MKICRDLQTAEVWCRKKCGFVTPWSGVLLKLVVIQLVKEAPAFYGIRRFIIVFSLVRKWA
jgi:hypothetical protein